MSFHTPAEKQTRTGAESPASREVLKRKGDDDRETFNSDKSIGLSLAENSFGPASIGTSSASRFGIDLSGVKLHAGEFSPTLPKRSAPLMVQRSPLEDGEKGSAPCPDCPEAAANQNSGVSEPAPESSEPVTEAAPTSEGSQPEEETATPVETTAAALIVEDSAEELKQGQMRKSEFLARLRAEVSRAVDAALAGTGRDTEGCPYLENWFSFYDRQDSAHVERAIRKYAPETARVTTAGEYMPIIAERARRSAEVWARTGEITGIPEGLPMGISGMPGMGLLGGIGRLFSGIGSMFFKARDGGAGKPDDPRAVQAELGEGQPLDSGVRSRMESAFGMDFSHVRTHTDTTAAGLSNHMNARAFTVGKDVAFGAGEYQPGTMIGDALVAHELAHVVQQGGSNNLVAKKKESAGYHALEEDADLSAVGAVTSLWSGTKGSAAYFAQNSVPQLRSGLRLQRCGRDTSRQLSNQDSTTQTNKLASLCDQKKCLSRSSCDANTCKKEAKTIADTFVMRVNAIRRPDLPNRGDIHWGWLCYQWADLLTKEFKKLNLNCWKLPWVGIVTSGAGTKSLEHNYIFASLGSAESSEGPVRECGKILDPWRTGNPVVYDGDWDWHKWNYIHNAETNIGKYYENGSWTSLYFPIPATPEPGRR